MTLDLVFGWHLDGLVYPENANGQQHSLASAVVGPAGLCEQLAIRLGLRRPPIAQAVRIARYLNALNRHDNGDRFYSKSFAVDSWSTARYLLVVRDELVANGWNGVEIADAGKRIHTLAQIEATIEQRDLFSSADIVRDVFASLKKGQKAHIRSIKIATPWTLLPAVYQDIFQLLNYQGTEIEELQVVAQADSGSDLGKVQRFLLRQEKPHLSGDDSFCLLEADDEFQLAETVSGWLASASNSDLVIIRGQGSSILDECCHCLGLPRIGGSARSRWRSVQQILPLLFENCWLPPNPLRVLELLSLPFSPINSFAAHKLARALRAEPGFGGQQWANAWQEIIKQRSEYLHSGEASEAVIEKQLLILKKDLQFWLEPERHDPAVGIPTQQVSQICRKVRDWCSNRVHADKHESSLLAELGELSIELEKTVVATSRVRIAKTQFERILDAVFGDGTTSKLAVAEVAPWSLVDHPGQIWAGTGSVLWWGFTSDAVQGQLRSPWTEKERIALHRAHVVPETPSQKITREGYTWRYPLVNAINKILIARPRVVHGEPVAIHPFWDELQDLIPQRSPLVRQAHHVMSDVSETVLDRTLQLVIVAQQPLPKETREWHIAPNVITHREQESASSLQMLLGCPFAWTMQYQANMHPGVMMLIPDGDQLVGDLTHAIYTSVFASEDLSPDVVAVSTEAAFDQLAQNIALPLFLPGRKVERERVRQLIIEAACRFAGMLQEAGLSVVGCELYREVDFGDSKFVGKIDLVVEDHVGKLFIIDYKWAKRIKYRIEEIKQGKHIQLAAYSSLLVRSHEISPHSGQVS